MTTENNKQTHAGCILIGSGSLGRSTVKAIRECGRMKVVFPSRHQGKTHTLRNFRDCLKNKCFSQPIAEFGTNEDQFSFRPWMGIDWAKGFKPNKDDQAETESNED